MSDKYPGGFVTANAPAGFSVAFDGTGDRVDVASNAAFGVGTGDFTVEGWLYWVADGSNAPTVFSIGNVNSGGSLNIFVDGTYGLYVRLGTSDTRSTAAYNMLGKWIHFAAVRTSGVIALYYNGVSQAVTTSGASNSITATAPVIGWCAASAGNQGYLNGYISNLRYSNTAVYSANFTPPTQLFKTSSAILLACQSPTIIDNSNNAFALTPVGNTVVSNFTPFAAYQGFNPALGAAAGGVWTLDEAAYYQNNRQWPIYDPYFNNTTLMLHGNGTNAAQNNTFLDSSTNNFTITRNGNTTQGTFTPFSQTGWSYNGTAGAYCQLNNADYAIGTGDFTIEFWMYCVDDTSYGSSAFAGLSGAGVLTVSMSGGSSNARQPYLEFGGTSVAFGTLYGYLNRWTHIAYVRTSGYVVVYQNGVATAAPISKAQSFPNCANLVLARLPTDTGQDFRGYLSNFRITKAAVYSSNFTPSTQPLTAITSTQLLTFQDNRFRDNSANNSTVTPAGTASVQAFSPFVPAYITPTTYSNRFAATSYLSIASNAAFALPGAFTIEFWIYFSTFEAANRLIAGVQTAGGLTFYTNGTTISPNVYGTGNIFTASNTVVAGQWYHYALSRDASNNMRMWVNGLSVGSTTTASSYAQGAYQINDSAGSMAFVISNLREVKGSTVYDPTQTNITPPTAPLTAISGTQLLTCQSSTFVDNSTNNFTITSSGTVQPVTSPTPFPAKVDTTTLNSAYSTSLIGGSAYFDGSGDNLTWSGTAIGSGDYTVECWFYATAYATYTTIVGALAGGTNAFALYVNSATQVQVDHINVGPVNFTVSSMSLNSWNHLVVTRSSGNLTVFVNGVRSSTGVVSNSSNYSNTTLSIGYGSGATYFPGYISNLRIVTGTSVYNPNTTGFVPPSTPLTAVSGTQLLLNYTNGAIFDNTAKNVLETVGSVQISTTQSKWGGSSMWFQAGGTLSMLNNPGLQFGTGDFTVEWWMYWNTVNNSGIISGSGNGSTDIRYSSGALYLGKFNQSLDSSFAWTPSTGQWYHVAMTRSGSSLRAFVNGVQIGTTATNSGTYNCVGTSFYVGTTTFGSAGDTPLAYIDDLRITKGVARYVTNFTPPTSQLQDQ